jgi:hypothetical protein
MITKSLDVALQRLRSPEKIQHIWADGICINQQNILERESQVKLMGLVYTQAKMVKIWLGPDTLHVAKKAFGLVEQFSLNLANYRDITMDWSPLVELSSLEYFKRGSFFAIDQCQMKRPGHRRGRLDELQSCLSIAASQ